MGTIQGWWKVYPRTPNVKYLNILRELNHTVEKRRLTTRKEEIHSDSGQVELYELDINHINFVEHYVINIRHIALHDGVNEWAWNVAWQSWKLRHKNMLSRYEISDTFFHLIFTRKSTESWRRQLIIINHYQSSSIQFIFNLDFNRIIITTPGSTWWGPIWMERGYRGSTCISLLIAHQFISTLIMYSIAERIPYTFSDIYWYLISFFLFR